MNFPCCRLILVLYTYKKRFVALCVIYARVIMRISKRSAARLRKGGDNMTVLEVLALMNLIAVVIFGVIHVVTKK